MPKHGNSPSISRHLIPELRSATNRLDISTRYLLTLQYIRLSSQNLRPRAPYISPKEDTRSHRLPKEVFTLALHFASTLPQTSHGQAMLGVIHTSFHIPHYNKSPHERHFGGVVQRDSLLRYSPRRHKVESCRCHPFFFFGSALLCSPPFRNSGHYGPFWVIIYF